MRSGSRWKIANSVKLKSDKASIMGDFEHLLGRRQVARTHRSLVADSSCRLRLRFCCA
ncbi:hypothetical protein JOF47_000668 [Paeniglutamicibacter kerguelensis]|uniref:Uncharacterized protein n=1 Tax=Paeniglutamicibacter kerguelensis TaxID=254788 RepID=A0ABS4X9L3_9MICC|nr:hypothetical protein [Paeniglutamicibacter kerguelensis]